MLQGFDGVSDFQKFCIAFWIIVGLFLVGGFSYKAGKRVGYRQGYDAALNEPHKADTVWRTDTFLVDNPVEVIRWKDKLVYVPVTDSVIIHQHDTTYVALEFEKVEYADSTYRATVSGFQPRLESISVYPKTAYITKYVPEYKYPSFILSPALNAYVLPDSFGIGAGMELDYWINRLEFFGGVGYGVQDSHGERTTGWYAGFGIKYNVIRR